MKLDDFPWKCKIAKKKPLFKKGIKTDAENCRPFFLLPLISKVMKTIHDRSQDYLQRNKLLYIYQSGFRASPSTDTCLSQLTDVILNSSENGKHTGMILVDLQKISDTLDHKILFNKIKCIGLFRLKNKMVSLHQWLFTFYWTMCFQKHGS